MDEREHDRRVINHLRRLETVVGPLGSLYSVSPRHLHFKLVDVSNTVRTQLIARPLKAAGVAFRLRIKRVFSLRHIVDRRHPPLPGQRQIVERWWRLSISLKSLDPEMIRYAPEKVGGRYFTMITVHRHINSFNGVPIVRSLETTPPGELGFEDVATVLEEEIHRREIWEKEDSQWKTYMNSLNPETN